MAKQLRVLLIEDSDDDAQLLLFKLKDGNYDPHWKRVDTYDAVVSALDHGEWDLILCDYQLPGFSGVKALATYKEKNLDIPFIFVSGIMGEDIAIEAMKSGAHDWIIKGNFSRLIPAIEREIREADIRFKQRIAVESLRKLSMAVDQSPVSVVITDINGAIEFVNPKFTELTGYTTEEAIGQNPRMLKSGLTPIETYNDLWENISNGNNWKGEFCNKKKNGELYWESASISPVYNSEGELTNFVAVKEDITEKKFAEVALMESEERFRTIFEEGPIGMATVDTNFKFIKANDAFCKMMGYSDQDLNSMTFKDLTHPDHLDKDIKKVMELSAGKIRQYHTEKKYINKKKEVIWGSLTVAAIRNKKGEYSYSLAMVKDITEQKCAEENLKIMHERYSLAVKAGNFGVWDRDVQKNKLIWDERMFELYGLHKSEFGGSYESWLKFLHPEDKEHCHADIQKALAGEGEYNTEFRIITHLGSVKYIKAYGYVVRDNFGNPIRMTGINFDISQNKLAEKALFESEERYRIFINSMDDMTFLKDEKFKYRIVNSVQAEYFAKTPEEIIGKTDFELMPKEAAQQCYVSDNIALTSDAVTVIEEKVGDRIYETHKFRVPLPGSTFGVGGYIVDITKRKRSEQLLNALNQAAIQMGTELSLDDIYLTVSKELKKLGFSCMVFPLDENQTLAYTKFVSYDSNAIKMAEDIIGIQQKDFFIKIDDFAELQKVIFEKETLFVDDTVITIAHALPEGAKLYADEIINALGIQKNILAPLIIENKVAGIFSVQSNDLTESDKPAITAFALQMASSWYKADLYQNLKKNLYDLKLAQESLKENEEIFTSFMEHSPIYVFFKDHETKPLRLSKNYENMMGKPMNEILGKTMDELFPSELAKQMIQDDLNVIRNKVPLNIVEELNGRIYETIKFPIISPGKPAYLAGYTIDVTESKLAEAALNKSREQLKKFAAHLQSIREEERVLLAREIHDELGQILTAIKIDTGLLKQKISKGIELTTTEEIVEEIIHLSGLVDKTIRTTRKIMTELRPEVLDALGFVEALKSHANEFSERYKIRCEVESSLSKFDLSQQQSVALFRIFQEALNNVARHSKATKVQIQLIHDNMRLIMNIIDNGIGLDEQHKTKLDSYGIIGMRERVFLLDGELSISGKPGKGTAIKIDIPYIK
jgi:PAS domain S-box-containing protein